MSFRLTFSLSDGKYVAFSVHERLAVLLYNILFYFVREKSGKQGVPDVTFQSPLQVLYFIDDSTSIIKMLGNMRIWSDVGTSTVLDTSHAEYWTLRISQLRLGVPITSEYQVGFTNACSQP